MILTVAELRESVESSLGDDALQILLNWAEEQIVARAGATGARTQLFDGGHRFLSLDRPAASVTSVTETWWTTDTVLTTDDWLLRPGDYLIERLNTGTNPRLTWARKVSVLYVPVDQDATRIKVQIDLCNLALDARPGLASETIGEWTQAFTNNSAWNTGTEIQTILAQLNVDRGMVVVGDSRWGW